MRPDLPWIWVGFTKQCFGKRILCMGFFLYVCVGVRDCKRERFIYYHFCNSSELTGYWPACVSQPILMLQVCVWEGERAYVCARACVCGIIMNDITLGFTAGGCFSAVLSVSAAGPWCYFTHTCAAPFSLPSCLYMCVFITYYIHGSQSVVHVFLITQKWWWLQSAPIETTAKLTGQLNWMDLNRSSVTWKQF